MKHRPVIRCRRSVPSIPVATLVCLLLSVAIAGAPPPARAASGVNLWPLFRHKDGVTDVLWPLLRYDANTNDFRVFPLIEERGDALDLLWPICHWSPDHKRLLPVIAGTQVVEADDATSAAAEGRPTTTTAPYYAVLPLYFQSKAVTTLFPLLWRLERGWAVFPLYGQWARPLTVAAGPGRRETRTIDERWRFVLWPLFTHVRSDVGYHLDLLLTSLVVTKHRGGSRWQFFPIIPLVSHEQGGYSHVEQTNGESSVRGRNGRYRTWRLFPLIRQTTIAGEWIEFDDQQRVLSPRPGEFDEMERIVLFLWWQRALREADAAGEDTRERTFLGLLPLYWTAHDSARQERSHNLLLFLFNMRSRGDDFGWSSLGYLTGYKREAGASRFHVLWRLFEYTKDTDGHKRLRLFYLPSFGIG